VVLPKQLENSKSTVKDGMYVARKMNRSILSEKYVYKVAQLIQRNQISIAGPGEGLGALVTLVQVVEHSFSPRRVAPGLASFRW
jgi:hypothetical protein